MHLKVLGNVLGWFALEFGGLMLYIAIGRNVGDKPMSRRKWRKFQSHVAGYVAGSFSVGKLPDTVALGKSSFEGQREDTCVMVWFDVTEFDADKCLLGFLATAYGQEAIAWSVSETNFVEGL